MKMKILLTLLVTVCFVIISCYQKNKSVANKNGRILKVPSEFPTIENAVNNAKNGDWIILAPGNYSEMKIDLDKSVTISSDWKISGDLSKIDETIIDSHDSILFNIKTDSVEISGLKIINGDHPLNIMAKAIIRNNHFINNLDAISFEGSGGGYAGYNTIENDRDDGLDLDIIYGEENKGSNITVEYNTIIKSNDDGIEIRLFDYPDQNINYIIRGNRITGSNNAGIQIISYDIFTGKTFEIHHNIISGCKTGLGCMEGSNTREDLTGASKMDELILLFNNTLVNNQMGATGGNNIIAVNNLIQGNSIGGFKRFGSNSVINKNIFYQNAGKDLIEIADSASRSGNIIAIDPLIDPVTFIPAPNSKCIDGGESKIELNDIIILEVPEDLIAGSAPDLGAIESKTPDK